MWFTKLKGAVAFDDFSSKRQPCYYVLLLLFWIIVHSSLIHGTTKTPFIWWRCIWWRCILWNQTAVFKSYKCSPVLPAFTLRSNREILYARATIILLVSTFSFPRREYLRNPISSFMLAKEPSTWIHGIYSTSISKDTLDEAPMAYKSLNDITDVIGDTVEIIDVMKPVYNFKAVE